jgi:hypothetical protein
MALVSTGFVIKLLAPYVLDLVVDMLTVEKDPEQDTDFKKHNTVLKKTAAKLKDDPAFSHLGNRDIMDMLNLQIKKVIAECKKEELDND